MKSQLINRFFEDKAWFFAKITIIPIWFGTILSMVSEVEKCLYPTGVCTIYSFNPLFTPTGKILVLGFVFIAGIAYIFEYSMLITTALMFFLSLIITSFHESNGLYYRSTIFSLIFGVQSFAYLRSYFKRNLNLSDIRQQYSRQMIVAYYTLAGISKVYNAGLLWGINSKGFSLQILKNYSFQYFDSGNSAINDQALQMANFFSNHYMITNILLMAALFLELFCFIALVNINFQRIWGIGLTLMHAGIAFFMKIGISVIAFPMVIFFLNPLFIINELTNRMIRMR